MHSDFARIEGKALDALSATVVLAHVDLDLTLIHYVYVPYSGFVQPRPSVCVRHFLQREFGSRLPLAVERITPDLLDRVSLTLTDPVVFVVLGVEMVDDQRQCRMCKLAELTPAHPALEER